MEKLYSWIFAMYLQVPIAPLIQKTGAYVKDRCPEDLTVFPLLVHAPEDQALDLIARRAALEV